MKRFLFCLCVLVVFACDTEEVNDVVVGNNTPNTQQVPKINYLALGDSYTKGESVCESCNFPTQLSVGLNVSTNKNVELKTVAQTGWTTNDLLYSLSHSSSDSHYDLVTLLIGVNNQYGQENFSIYENEFKELLDKAIIYANGNSAHVVVISIPDYTYTPYGNSLTEEKRQTISNEIDAYNTYAEQQTTIRNVTFVNINDITRNGLNQPDLVASDGLHPSSVAYQKMVERLLPIVKSKLNL